MAKRIIIPARFSSTRLPGKVLLDIAGKPMLQHVYDCSTQCNVDSILIATDHDDVYQVAKAWGADVCMTALKHKTGTDRLAEAAVLRHYADDDLIVNVQADEPLIPKANIEQVFEDLATHPDASIATLMDKLDAPEDIASPHAVKVVTDHIGYALYFSRTPIPHGDAQHWIHIGIYGYRGEFLKHYAQLTPSPLEQSEKLEQLRALWHGYKIHVTSAPEPQPPGIDTEIGLARIRAYIAKMQSHSPKH